MDKNQKLNRIEYLIETLNAASKAYYVNNDEILSNYEYDLLYDELVELEAQTGTISPDSPTQSVGFSVVESLTKVAHEKRILSLDKTKKIDELKAFLGTHRGLLVWKLDGLNITLKYEGGKLSRAITRGNGEIGEDVTHNAKHFVNVPQSIAYGGALSIRGEAVISYSEFERINSRLDEAEKYKNPRNLCSGTVRQLDSKVLRERRVAFYAFSAELDDEMGINSKQKLLERAREQGFTPIEYVMVDENDLESAVAQFKENVHSRDLPTDGLVLTFDDIAYSHSLGATAKFPKDSIAFKWEDETARTKLIKIEWNTSRTGLINPVAIFEPVELEGTTVERASLHNLSIVRNLKLGVGDEISVYKANMIIPQVAENFSRSDTAEIPSECNVCGFKTEVVASGTAEFLYCKNPGCGAQLKHTLSHFVSRDAMNIEGLSEASIERFIDRGFINSYTDLFELVKFEAEITNMEGFGRKSYENLIAAIESSKNVALPNFIYALGIGDVGLTNAKLLCEHFDNDLDAIIYEAGKKVHAVFEDVKGIGGVSAGKLRAYFMGTGGAMPLSEKLKQSLYEHFNNDEDAIALAARYAPKDKPFGDIKGFGEEIIANLRNYFTNAENLARIQKVLPILRIQKPELSADGGFLDGHVFVITGSLEHFANRGELSNYIERQGGKVASSVSAKTTYLINNDASSGSSKNKKAMELGVEIITEAEFMERFGE